MFFQLHHTDHNLFYKLNYCPFIQTWSLEAQVSYQTILHFAQDSPKKPANENGKTAPEASITHANLTKHKFMS